MSHVWKALALLVSITVALIGVFNEEIHDAVVHDTPAGEARRYEPDLRKCASAFTRGWEELGYDIADLDLDYWTNEARGRGMVAAFSSFVSVLHLAETPEAIVNWIYLALFARNAGTVEARVWVDEIAHGAAPWDVAHSIAKAREWSDY